MAVNGDNDEIEQTSVERSDLWIVVDCLARLWLQLFAPFPFIPRDFRVNRNAMPKYISFGRRHKPTEYKQWEKRRAIFVKSNLIPNACVPVPEQLIHTYRIKCAVNAFKCIAGDRARTRID